ncbi:hypothetical protein Bca4012_062297 [Brassica carinata]
MVRRQAVATLCCVMGIVRLQALARGREIRHSDIGVEVQRKCRLILFLSYQENKLPDDDTYLGIKKLTANAFAQKVMLVKTITMSESRSSWWIMMLVYSYHLLASSPNVMPVHLENDSSNSVWLENWSASGNQFLNLIKHQSRKLRRRKCINPVVENSIQPQPVPQKEVEKPAPALEEPVEDAFDEEKTDEKGETVVEQPEELKHIHEPVVTNETLDSTLVNQIEESEENVIPEREDVKEERTPKQKNKETPNSSQGLPSYMQATKSAKAKLRLQGSSSPKQQGTEKATRRYWLPSSGNNARVTSDSPKTTRVSNSGGKTGKKTEKPLLNG